MINNTEKDTEDKSAPTISKEMEQFESFIKKKMVQNEVLKRIISKLNTDQNIKSNK